MAEKKRVALVVEATLGGIRQHVYDIVCGLDNEKFEVFYIYSDLRADDTFFEQKAEIEKHATIIECNEMQRELGFKDVAAYRKLVSIFKEIKPDIVHCHSSKAGIVGRLAARKCGVPKIVYTPNAYAFQTPECSFLKKILYVNAEKFLSRHACNVTINVSKGEMNLAQHYHLDKPNKFVLIYNGIPDVKTISKEEARTRLNLPLNKIIVGFTGRCAKQKDPFSFLKIAKEIVETRDDVDFVYVGDGPMEVQMKEWVEENRLASKIHILGFRKDASEIVSAFDVYLSTALYEGLPYSMIEAMRAGVPIVATNCVGNAELIREGKEGVTFPIGHCEVAIDQLNRQIEASFEPIDERKALFEDKYKLCTMLRKTEDLYMG